MPIQEIQINDPFQETNLITPTHIVEENKVLRPTTYSNSLEELNIKKKVKKNKFSISKDLKKRLLTLIEKTENEDAKTIAQAILDLKYEPESGYNYLGLSKADFTKISYLDADRIEKFKDETLEYECFDKDSKLIRGYFSYDYRNGSYNIMYRKINLYARQFDHILKLEHISNFDLESPKLLKQKTNNELKFEDFSNTVNFRKENLNLNADKLKITYDDETYYSIRSYVILPDSELVDKVIEASNRSARSYSFYVSQNATLKIYGPNCSSEFLYWLSGQQDEIYIIPTKKVESKLWDYSIRYHTKVGKIVRKIFGNVYDDSMIGAFSEEYQKLTTINKKGQDYFELSGEAIREAYHEDNAVNNGPLGNSCMRYSKCQSYLNIYVENKFCKLAVVKYRNKVIARALLWEIEGITYYDRIYYSNNEALYTLENILKSKNYINCYSKGLSLQIPIPLETFKSYDKYPYMDSFSFYHEDAEVLATYEGGTTYYTLRRTSGDYETNGDYMYCSHCDERSDSDDLVEISRGFYRGDYMCTNCAVYTSNDEWILEADAETDIYGETIYNGHAIRLFDGSCVHEEDDHIQQFQNGYGMFHPEYHSYYEHPTRPGVYYHTNDPEYDEIIEEQKQKETQND